MTNESIVDGSSCTWTLNGQALVPGDNLHNIDFTASDDDSASSAANVPTTQHVLTVQPEEASLRLDGGNPTSVKVATDGGDSSAFSLLFDAWETNNVSPPQPDAADNPHTGTAAFGDLNNAKGFMILTSVGPGGAINVSCNLNGVNGAGYTQVASFQCDVSGVPVNTYRILAKVEGLSGTTHYYHGSDENVLVIYDPSLGFTTGGGFFYWPGTDDKTNFGYNMKYNKNGTRAKGSLLLIRHLPDGSKFRVKSNAITGLALGEGVDFGWASFNGKNTYLEPGMLEPEGNHSFVAYVEDHGEPGTGVDRFWIEVRDKDGNAVTLTLPSPGDANAEVIDGGNIVVPHQNQGGQGNGKS